MLKGGRTRRLSAPSSRDQGLRAKRLWSLEVRLRVGAWVACRPPAVLSLGRSLPGVNTPCVMGICLDNSQRGMFQAELGIVLRRRFAAACGTVDLRARALSGQFRPAPGRGCPCLAGTAMPPRRNGHPVLLERPRDAERMRLSHPVPCLWAPPPSSAKGNPTRPRTTTPHLHGRRPPISMDDDPHLHGRRPPISTDDDPPSPWTTTPISTDDDPLRPRRRREGLRGGVSTAPAEPLEVAPYIRSRERGRGLGNRQDKGGDGGNIPLSDPLDGCATSRTDEIPVPMRKNSRADEKNSHGHENGVPADGKLSVNLSFLSKSSVKLVDIP